MVTSYQPTKNITTIRTSKCIRMFNSDIQMAVSAQDDIPTQKAYHRGFGHLDDYIS
jgi:hypothetical protein